ncbi:MAG: transporter [Herbaspirillum sp.]|jgi:EmrB/QacA subfamily drug resistance transporter|nr:transporter [Herbaspirillum sp.]
MNQALSRNPMIVPVVVASAFFLENFDSTVVATALPQMAVSFNATAVELSIGITAYMLTVAIFIPVSGWCCDRFGMRNVFRCAIALFTLASILCGLSETLTQFTLARILQGIGGAMMIPVGRLIVLRSVDKKQFVKAMSFVTVPSVLGQVLGPPIGGFVTTWFSWKWIFFINVPIGILGVVAVTAVIQNFRQLEVAPLDWSGFALTGVAIGGLMYGLELVVRPETVPAMIPFFIALGIGAGAMAIRHARRHSNAVLDLSLLNIPTFRLLLIGGFGFRMTAGAVGFLLPLQLQIGFGMTAFASGLLTLFIAVGTFMMKTVGPPILRRFGFRNVLLANGLLGALSILVYAFFTPSTSLLLISIMLFCGGLFRSLHFTSINTAAYADIAQRKMSSATSLASTADRFGIGAGVSLSAIFLHAVTAPGAMAETADFQIVFAGIALLGLISTLPFLWLAREAGSELSGHVCGDGGKLK